jgi:hypothetical protein
VWPDEARPGAGRVLLDTAPAVLIWVMALQAMPGVTRGILQATRVALLYAVARG